MIAAEDKKYLRGLAKQVKEMSQSPRNLDVIGRYKCLNSLKKPASIPIMIGLVRQAIESFMEHEEIRMREEPFKSIEYRLKWKLCKARKLPDDTPITNNIYTGLHYRVTDWMDGHKTVRIEHDLKSSFFEPCIVRYDDAKKLRKPELIVNHDRTNADYEIIQDVFGDISTIIKGSPYGQTKGWGDSIIDEFVEMRGLEQVFFDLIDAPEFVHEVMDFMTNARLDLLKQFKHEGILVLNNSENVIGSTLPGFCDELPGNDYDHNNVKECNLWGYAQAQEFSEVSPAMLEEFVLPYQAKIINKFGLSAYGCCENIEEKIGSIVRYIDNLRVISISPFTNHRIAAEKCKQNYVYAWKPHPSQLSVFDESAIKSDLEKTLSTVKECCVSINLRDCYVYGDEIYKYSKWLEIARNVSQSVYSN